MTAPVRVRVARMFTMLLGVLAVAALAIGILIWRHPIGALAWAGRATLRWSGFERLTAAAPAGPVTYFRAGHGRSVILLHGVNDQAGTWARIAPVLARQYEVIVVDLPGHGASEPQSGPLTVQDLMDGVDAVVRAEAHGHTLVLAGNSLGGFLSLWYAQQHPDRIAQVVVVNGTIDRGQGMPSAAATLLPKTRDEARKAMEALMSPSSPRVPDFVLDDLVRMGPSSPLARLVAAYEKSPWPLVSDEQLYSLKVPVTIIWGRDDGLLDLSYARRAAASIAGARLEILPDCGHMPQRECPGPLLSSLREVLAGLPPIGTTGPEGE